MGRTEQPEHKITSFGGTGVTEAQLRRICGANLELLSKAKLRQREFSIVKAQSDQFDADAKHTVARVSKNIARIAPVVRRLNLILKQEPMIAEILAKDIGIKGSKLTELTKKLELAVADRATVSGTFKRGRKSVDGRDNIPLLVALVWVDICQSKALRTVLARSFVEFFRCPPRAAKREAARAFEIVQNKHLRAMTMAVRQGNNGILFDEQGLIASKEQNDEVSVRQYLDFSRSRRTNRALAKGQTA